MTANLPALPSNADNGYDWMAALPAAWKPTSSWGEDGWDLGDWPYVIVCLYVNPLHDLYACATYVEGDVFIEQRPSLEELYAFVDRQAEFFWRHGRGAPHDLPEGSGMLNKHCGPYRGHA